MWIRSLVTSAAIVMASPVFAQENARIFSPTEARELAVAALANGYPRDAILIARALLARDPDDVSAHLLWAEAALMMQDTEAVRTHATQAYFASRNPDAKFQAARLVAISHLQNNQLTRTQIWLRRARAQATTPQQIQQLTVDYRQVRALNPLHIDATLSATPSSNVNNGSANTTMMAPFLLPGSGIIFTEADISDESQALDGWLYGATLQMSYRLSESQTARSSLGFAASYDGVIFSTASADTAENITEGDFEQAQASISYSYQWLTETHATMFRAAVGRSWYGGDVLTDYTSFSLGRKWAVGQTGSFSLTATGEFTTYALDSVTTESQVISATREWTLDNRDRFSLGFAYRDTHADDEARSFVSNRVTLGYDFAKPWNNVMFGLNASREWREYGPILLAPDGRSDRRTTLSVDAEFRGVDFYGFHPTVTLTASRNDSNVALYETESLGLGFGFASSF